MDINIRLNQNQIYMNKECVYCKRKYPDTILNIEGYIHHNCELRCLDQKKCKKIARKLNKT